MPCRSTLPTAAASASVIDSWALPPRLVHLVLVNGEFIPPQLRAERCLAAG
jgi:hypothetical protein